MRRSGPSPSLLGKLNVLAAFSLCTAAAWFALHRLGYPLIGIDDANIYFVYARNLANGHGFVYNIGGERVEGFTSLLWTLISALAFKWTGHAELTLWMINIILVSLGVAYALSAIQKPYPRGMEQPGSAFLGSGIYLVLVFTTPRYIVWNTAALMENALWSTLLLVMAVYVTQEGGSDRAAAWTFSLLSVLLLLTRPESLLWVVVFAAVLYTRRMFRLGHVLAWRTLAPGWLGFLVGVFVLTVFRLHYFGYPLPNTYYAKVAPSFVYNLEQGMLYLVRYIRSDPLAAAGVLTIVLACIVSVLRPAPREGHFYLPGIAATGLLVPLLTGGDHFGSFRFYQNVFPITVLCMISFWGSLLSQISNSMQAMGRSGRRQRWIIPFLGVLVTAGFFVSQGRAWSEFSAEIKTEFNVAEYERRNGAFLQELFSPLPRLPSIGVIAAGGIKMTYSGEIVDLLGLNNTTMAHNQGDRLGYKGHAAFEVDTFFKLQPEIVWPILVRDDWQYREAELKNRWENILGFKGLFDDPHFLENYQYAKVSKASPAGSEQALVAWIRKDFLNGLRAREEFVVDLYEYSP